MIQLAWLPDLIRDPLVLLKNRYRRSILKNTLARLSNKRIVVGAGGTRFEGWIPTEQDVLNLLLESDWLRYFKRDSLDAILAEHVWEHLASEESVIAATNCFAFLKPGGYLRVAVPDGFHPDADYVESVRPGGSGAGADDHKVLYTYDRFRDLFYSIGFDVVLLEYFDERGEFHYQEWSSADGFVERSRRFDSRNADGRLSYTSIILDARKPVDHHD
jgi:predicted SAM-dependent methyltransferase